MTLPEIITEESEESDFELRLSPTSTEQLNDSFLAVSLSQSSQNSDVTDVLVGSPLVPRDNKRHGSYDFTTSTPQKHKKLCLGLDLWGIQDDANMDVLLLDTPQDGILQSPDGAKQKRDIMLGQQAVGLFPAIDDADMPEKPHDVDPNPASTSTTNRFVHELLVLDAKESHGKHPSWDPKLATPLSENNYTGSASLEVEDSVDKSNLPSLYSDNLLCENSSQNRLEHESNKFPQDELASTSSADDGLVNCLVRNQGDRDEDLSLNSSIDGVNSQPNEFQQEINHSSEQDVDGSRSESDEAGSNPENVNERVGMNNDPLSSPKRGGRRRPRRGKWRRTIRKKKRNSGKRYTNYRGRRVTGKKFTPIVCNCKRECGTKLFSPDDQRGIFTPFWNIGDINLQNSLLYGLVQCETPKRQRSRTGTQNRQNTFKYFFKKDGISIQVCSSFFLGVLQVPHGRVYRCVTKGSVDDIADKRGGNHNKTDTSSISNHIKKFPMYTSHYARHKAPNKRYLSGNLNIAIMYRMYVEDCEKEGIVPLPEKMYYHVFRNEFNLSFKSPKTDTCKTCDTYNMRISEESDEEKRVTLKTELDEHLLQAELTRESMNNDIKKASDNYYMFTFDLEQALPYPKLTTSVAYYSRNMYVYNLGIHAFYEGGESGKGYMYMFCETEGGRGSQDISTCLVKHVTTQAADSEHVVAYCDSCTGQNRNIKISLSLLKLLQSEKIKAKTIDIKFMVSGHSYLPNDRDFGVIEKASKRFQITVPEDWFNVVRKAKRILPKFEVIEMKREEFLSTVNLEKSVNNRKITIDKQKVNWLKIRWLRFERESPMSFKFKETLDQGAEFHEVDLRKGGRGRPLTSLKDVEQSLLYPQRRPVTQKKKNDMLSLLPYIHPDHRKYFRELPIQTSTRSGTANEKKNTGEDEIEMNDEPIYDD